MNILYVITDMGLGGAEILLVNLANEMRLRGHHIEIVVLGKTNSHVKTIDPAIPVHQVGMKKSPIGILQALAQLRQLSKTREWHIVHSHMFHANLIARLAKYFFSGAKIISSAHSDHDGGRLRTLAYRMTERLSNLNTNVSQDALDKYVEVGAFQLVKSLCVYNFIDTVRYRKITEARMNLRKANNVRDTDLALLTVGRMVPEKNQALLLKACSLLVADFPNLRIFLVGDGVLRPDLERQSNELGLSRHVVFCGMQRNVADWCSFADLFVLTSDIEGFGLVLAEAMACECPTISTDVGGCAEVVGNPDLLVKAKSEAQLAEKISNFLQMSGAERREIGRVLRDRVVKNFDLKTVVGQWENIYRSLLLTRN